MYHLELDPKSVVSNDRQLRVLLISPDYPPALGGIQRLLHSITSAMPRAETRVVTLGHPRAADFDSCHDQHVKRLNVGISSAFLRNVVFNIGAIINVPNWKPDVILNGHIVSAPAATVLARRFRAKNVLYTYGKEVSGRPGLTAWALRNADVGIAVSEFTKSQIVQAVGSGSLPSPVFVIHPGVQLPSNAVGSIAERPTILTTARLRDWYKGHDKILEALPAVKSVIPTVRWVVIGDGPIRSALEERVRGLGLSGCVEFQGAVSDQKRDEWLARASVFAMPARYPRGEIGGEGFPVVYLEASAWGLPVVAGNVGGPREAVLHGETGLLVDPESSKDIADALIRLLSDQNYARRLGQQGRSRVEGAFLWEQVALQLENALRAIIGTNSNGKRH